MSKLYRLSRLTIGVIMTSHSFTLSMQCNNLNLGIILVQTCFVLRPNSIIPVTQAKLQGH